MLGRKVSVGVKKPTRSKPGHPISAGTFFLILTRKVSTDTEYALKQ